MKKPVIKKEIVAIESQSVVKASSKTTGSIINILSKLEPQQLLDLADKVTTLGQSYLEYGIEKERTKQVAIQATVRMREIDAEVEIAHLEHEQIMTQMYLVDRENERQFLKEMKILEDEFNQLDVKKKYIDSILDLLKEGKISETALVDLLKKQEFIQCLD